MNKQTGTFPTQHASKYLQQMCKHFAHKVDVEYDRERGEAALPVGPATFHASDTDLTVIVTGKTEEDLKLARHVIDVHLQRFAHREKFEQMLWENMEVNAVS